MEERIRFALWDLMIYDNTKCNIYIEIFLTHFFYNNIIIINFMINRNFIIKRYLELYLRRAAVRSRVKTSIDFFLSSAV